MQNLIACTALPNNVYSSYRHHHKTTLPNATTSVAPWLLQQNHRLVLARPVTLSASNTVQLSGKHVWSCRQRFVSVFPLSQWHANNQHHPRHIAPNGQCLNAG